MSNEFKCEIHGAAQEAFVCEHLAEMTESKWYSSKPSDEKLWPDAWCSQCHISFEKEGEWNEKAQKEANLKAKLLCNHCYESLRSKHEANYV